MEILKNLLAKRIRQNGLARQVGTAMIMTEFQKILDEKFGERVAKKVRPLYYKHGVVNVACLSSVMAQEINLQKQELITSLNKNLGQDFVKDIRLIV
jgi:predicted nucleic acid-binding Zn ribbon protein